MTRLHAAVSHGAEPNRAHVDDTPPPALPAAGQATPFTGSTPDHWVNPISADFAAAADWSTGAVPGAADDAILDAPGATPYTVTASTSQTVNSIQLASTATFAITGGAFTATNGTGAGVNAGVIDVGAGSFATFAVAGGMANSGTIDVNGGANGARLAIGTGGASLSGGGQIVLGNARYDEIIAYAATDTLTNIDNTISGGGQIGGSFNFSFVNQSKGVVDANSASYGLFLATYHQTVTNTGLLEATGGGGLFLANSTFNDRGGGVILAGAGSRVDLAHVTIVGGTLTSTGTGVIETAADSFNYDNVIDGTKARVTSSATIVVTDRTELTIQGAIANTGTIEVNGSANFSFLNIGAAGATLSGHGHVILGSFAKNTLTGSSTLTNVDNTIAGAGRLGAGQSLTVINQSKGIIDANSATGLTIDTGLASITNAGLIETTGKGVGVIVGAVANTGTIEAKGGTLTLQGAVTGTGLVAIVKGTLDIANANATENVAFTGKTGALELDQSQTYTGSVSGLSSKTQSLDLRDIVFDGTTMESYSGTATSGTLTVTHGTTVANIKLVGNYLTSTFTLSSDGHSGTKVVDPPASASIAPAHVFVAAAARFGASAAAVHAIADTWRAPAAMLAAPRPLIA